MTTRLDPSRLATVRTTAAPPHVRDAMHAALFHGYVLMALMPSVLLGLYHAGRQANLAMVELKTATAPGWRGTLLDALGIGYDPATVTTCMLHGVLIIAPLLVAALISAEIWRRVFSRHGLDEALAAAVIAVLFALAVAPATAAWKVVIGVSFGTVVGKEIFGGTGKNFLNPALTGIAFLYLAYPDVIGAAGVWAAIPASACLPPMALAAGDGLRGIQQAGVTWMAAFFGDTCGPIGSTSTLGALLGAALLLHVRLISWRILAGALGGLTATALLFEHLGGAGMPAADLPWYWHLNIGGFAFLLVFFATDPVTAATTNPGRWIYGVVIGVMTVLIRVANPTQTEGTVLAVLFGNIIAPITDYGVMWVDIRRRRRSLG
jgi:Na+-transporting NADH:ubiquinone oxidoreductase subunit B